MNAPTCKICSSTNTRKLLDWKAYTINQCQDCQILYSYPDPTEEDLTAYYQGFLHSKPKLKDIPKLLESKQKELIKLFDLKGIDLKGKKFLDFGAGVGKAYHAAKLLGLDSYYQDIDQSSIDFAKKHFDLDDAHFLPSLEGNTIKFDYIFVDNVIEHVLDPHTFVESIYAHLNEGGKLLFKTPNGANTEVFFYPRITFEYYFKMGFRHNSILTTLKMLFSRPWHCDPPRHLFSFHKNSFSAMMKKMSIPADQFDLATYTHDYFLFSLTRSFLFIDRSYKGISSILLRILLIPFVALELVTKVFHVVFRKLNLLSPVGLILIMKK